MAGPFIVIRAQAFEKWKLLERKEVEPLPLVSRPPPLCFFIGGFGAAQPLPPPDIGEAAVEPGNPAQVEGPGEEEEMPAAGEGALGEDGHEAGRGHDRRPALHRSPG